MGEEKHSLKSWISSFQILCTSLRLFPMIIYGRWTLVQGFISIFLFVWCWHFREHELKVITERINCAERNFSTLLKDFTAFSTGLVSLQETGMKISTSIDIYSDEEYPSMKASLAGISENIAAIQDLLGAQVTVFFCEQKINHTFLDWRSQVWVTH